MEETVRVKEVRREKVPLLSFVRLKEAFAPRLYLVRGDPSPQSIYNVDESYHFKFVDSIFRIALTTAEPHTPKE
ncbi:MAG: hypothetical protein A2170_07340 [Deltaproteobacteria bacterium RBG_13_53_10]|nr:MAG: hypothetical protein A2170_07340 [Deltaproteobacteria bacterium RBG_13_53_10]